MRRERLERHPVEWSLRHHERRTEPDERSFERPVPAVRLRPRCSRTARSSRPGERATIVLSASEMRSSRSRAEHQASRDCRARPSSESRHPPVLPNARLEAALRAPEEHLVEVPGPAAGSELCRGRSSCLVTVCARERVAPAPWLEIPNASALFTARPSPRWRLWAQRDG